MTTKRNKSDNIKFQLIILCNTPMVAEQSNFPLASEYVFAAARSAAALWILGGVLLLDLVF